MPGEKYLCDMCPEHFPIRKACTLREVVFTRALSDLAEGKLVNSNPL